MKMRQNLQDIYKILIADETLLRLLYYKPSNPNDNPLDPTKANILSMSEKEKWGIIDKRILRTQKTDDLTTDPICRICLFAGQRKNTRNYLVANQDVMFDVYTHLEFDEVDMRLSWIIDQIHELLFNNPITGMGKMRFVTGQPMHQAPNGFVGYRIVFEFGSGKE